MFYTDEKDMETAAGGLGLRDSSTDLDRSEYGILGSPLFPVYIALYAMSMPVLYPLCVVKGGFQSFDFKTVMDRCS